MYSFAYKQSPAWRTFLIGFSVVVLKVVVDRVVFIGVVDRVIFEVVVGWVVILEVVVG